MIDLSEKVARKQASLDKLNLYLKFLSKAKKAMAELPKLDTEKASRLLIAVKTKLTSMEVPHGYGKLNKQLLNEVNGLLDGVSFVDPSELTTPVFNQAVLDCKGHIRKIRLEILQLEQGDTQTDEDRETIRVLNETSKEKTSIQEIKDKPHLLVRASVIPIPDNAYINFAKLEGHFDLSNLSGYACLHNQLCLGINKKMIDGSVKEYLTKLVKQLSKKKGEKLMLLQDRGVISSLTGVSVAWYWLMTQHQAENFRQAFTSSSSDKTSRYISGISLRDWGFANAS